MTAQLPHQPQDAKPEEDRRAAAPGAPTGRRLDVPTLLREITTGSVAISVLAVVLSLLIGGVLIAATRPDVQAAAGYFFARPGDLIGAAFGSVVDAYAALFRGAVYNTTAPSFALAIRPLLETLYWATPLIAAGLGVALAFRVGLFNIGGRGQMLVAAAAAGVVGTSLELPAAPHIILTMLAGVVGGAVWAGIAGLLKAVTGAHEVITTIMLNFIAYYLLLYLLKTVLQAPGGVQPQAAAMRDTAVLPPLVSDRYNLSIGFLVVIAATFGVWWLLNRSTLGFKFRAVGENPDAARVAGIDVRRITVLAMVLSGALVGLAGTNQVQSTVTTGYTADIDAGIGFDAITVALLGRSTPWGTFVAGILFGAFKAGGYSMQAAEQVPIDIVLVVQSLIVLFIAAPPLVRAMFRLPSPDGRPRAKKPRAKKEQSR